MVYCHFSPSSRFQSCSLSFISTRVDISLHVTYTQNVVAIVNKIMLTNGVNVC